MLKNNSPTGAMEVITIRKAGIQDKNILLEFEQGVIRAERPFESTLKDDPLHYYDIDHMIAADHIELVVAEINSKVVGSGYVRIEESKHYLKHERHGYLGFMYVDPTARGIGVNKKIIEALQEWAAQKNITELQLDVYQDNLAAIKAYEKVGFSKLMIRMRKGLEK